MKEDHEKRLVKVEREVNAVYKVFAWYITYRVTTTLVKVLFNV